MPPMLRLAFCTVLSDIPASAAAFTMSSLASSFPSASRSSISLSACSVLVALLPPAPDSSSSAVMSYSPIHEKPVSGSRQKATGFPSGAREDLSWTITRTFGSRFTRPISRTLLAAARKSIEPKPLYALCPPAALLRCPIRITAQGYFHGHEVGGTNPSLLEALGSTDLNLLLDVSFNREVALDNALYWNKTDGNLANLIEKADLMPIEVIAEYGVRAKERIATAYSWDFISSEYRKVFLKR